MFDRRNYRVRADVLRRVVEWLLTQTGPAERVPDAVAEPTVALRILKRLAVVGLVRRAPSGWLPSPVLIQTPQLLPVSHLPFAHEES